MLSKLDHEAKMRSVTHKNESTISMAKMRLNKSKYGNINNVNTNLDRNPPNQLTLKQSAGELGRTGKD